MLKKSVYEKMINLVINSLPAALFAIDNYGKIIYFSTIRYSSASVEKLQGKSFDRIIKAIFHDEKPNLISEAYYKCKKERNGTELLRVRHVNNIGVECYYNLKFLYDHNEEIVVCFVQNITESVLIKEEITMLTEEYEETTKTLREKIAELDINLMNMNVYK
ncbi:MAG: hypothetical protein K0Q53_969 [Massilibacillus sp.]|jgi:hypothetical protein|nr:hypothetical protein [Massilibacillus sp.]